MDLLTVVVSFREYVIVDLLSTKELWLRSCDRLGNGVGMEKLDQVLELICRHLWGDSADTVNVVPPVFHMVFAGGPLQ